MATSGGKGTAEKMFKALLQLRQACCHPCIGSGGIGGGVGSRLGVSGGVGGGVGGGSGGQGRWLTMDQILDRYVRTRNGFRFVCVACVVCRVLCVYVCTCVFTLSIGTGAKAGRLKESVGGAVVRIIQADDKNQGLLHEAGEAH